MRPPAIPKRGLARRGRKFRISDDALEVGEIFDRQLAGAVDEDDLLAIADRALDRKLSAILEQKDAVISGEGDAGGNLGAALDLDQRVVDEGLPFEIQEAFLADHNGRLGVGIEQREYAGIAAVALRE